MDNQRLGIGADFPKISQAKEVELKKFADTHNDLVLEDEIDKLHFQDASAKQTLKDLVA